MKLRKDGSVSDIFVKWQNINLMVMGLSLGTKCIEKQKEMPTCREKIRKGKHNFLFQKKKKKRRRKHRRRDRG